MSTAQIRQRLHELIDTAEDKKLKAIYTLLEDDEPDGYSLSATQKKELDRRVENLQKGISKTYTWEETTAMAEQALADRKNSK
ncbi:MAG: addiction module protein [Mucilaginibacter sp.]|nr:addiction module protein [Mucilaginibacter sp.]